MVQEDNEIQAKGDIFNQQDLPLRQVEVPEWLKNGKPLRLWVRTMTAEESEAWLLVKERRAARLAALCICTRDGKRVFGEDDAHELGRKSAPAMDRIVQAILELNGLAPTSIEEAKKNSTTVPGGG